MLLSGYAELLKMGAETKKKSQKTTGWAWQRACLHLFGGMALYNQCFLGDPARDECSCPKEMKKKKKNTKFSIKYNFFSPHVASLGPSEAKIFYFLFPYCDITLFYHIFLCHTL